MSLEGANFFNGGTDLELEWERVEGSSLVAAAAYDEAAQQIHVQLHSGIRRTFDQCDANIWTTFLTATSKGAYLTNVLASREGRELRPSLRPLPSRAVLLNAFRPAQEISDPKLFAGRAQQVKELADALQVSGSCPLIYGDRGLGKSSLAVQGQLIAMGDSELLTQIKAPGYVIPDQDSYLTFYVSCSDEVRDVSALIQLLINAAEDVTAVHSTDRKANQLVDRKTRRRLALRFFETETTKTYEVEKQRLSYEQLSLPERLQRITRLLRQTYGCRVLFIIDELDRVRDKSGLASLAKATSTDDLKFVLVGIAQDWSDLLLDHASLERMISPIHVPRMQAPELAQIIDLAVSRLQEAGLPHRFDPAARTKLVRIAGGFPWFVHVLGQAALMAAMDNGEDVVSEARVTMSMRDMVSNRFAQRFADAYQKAVRDSVNREKVLRVLAAWHSPDIPTSAVYPVLRTLGVSNPAVYRGQLSRDEYGPVITTPGFQDRGLIRFRNAMFKQYIFMVPSLYRGVDQQVTEATRNF
jgi:Cdc6-like AAA superfamily ATPase